MAPCKGGTTALWWGVVTIGGWWRVIWLLVRRSVLSRLIAVHRKRGATVGYEGAKEDV